jgi:hypothetical protein
MPKIFDKYIEIQSFIKTLLSACNDEVRALETSKEEYYKLVNLKLTRSLFDNNDNKSVTENITTGDSYAWEIKKSRIKSIVAEESIPHLKKMAALGVLTGGFVGIALGAVSLFMGVNILATIITTFGLISWVTGFALITILCAIVGAAVFSAVVGVKAVIAGIVARMADINKSLTVTKKIDEDDVTEYKIVYNAALATESDISIDFSFYKKDLTSTKKEVKRLKELIEKLQEYIKNSDEAKERCAGFLVTDENSHFYYKMMAIYLHENLTYANDLKNISTGNVSIDALLKSMCAGLLEFSKTEAVYFYGLWYQACQDKNINYSWGINHYDLLIEIAKMFENNSVTDIRKNIPAAMFFYKQAELLDRNANLLFKIGELYLRDGENLTDYNAAANYMMQALSLGVIAAMQKLEAIQEYVDITKVDEVTAAIEAYQSQSSLRMKESMRVN